MVTVATVIPLLVGVIIGREFIKITPDNFRPVIDRVKNKFSF